MNHLIKSGFEAGDSLFLFFDLCAILKSKAVPARQSGDGKKTFVSKQKD